jgi:Tol biopolymer transport system component
MLQAVGRARQCGRLYWFGGPAVLALIWLAGTAGVAAESHGRSFGPALSADGRYLVFYSDAPDLVVGQVDHNSLSDVFLSDRLTGTTILVSHAAGSPNTTGNGDSFAGPISADGRYVAFFSTSTNLISGIVDQNQQYDLFLYDRLTGKTTLISHASGAPNVAANGATVGSLISADGNYLAVTSQATNLVPGQTDHNAIAGDPNSGYDVFLYHRPSGQITLVSRKNGAAATTATGNTFVSGISADGGFLVLSSLASDLVANGTDTNGKGDVFLYQRVPGTITPVSRAAGSPLRTANGSSGGGQISADGRWIAFQSAGSNLIQGQIDNGTSSFDEFLFDRVTAEMRLVSHTSASPKTATGAGSHILSGDGRFIAFASSASNLVPGQVDANGKFDLFLYDRTSGKTSLATHTSKSLTTATSGSGSIGLNISADGRYTVFVSDGHDLVSRQSDANQVADVFLYDRLFETVSLVSHSHGLLATAGNRGSFNAQISSDGSTVGFNSVATDLGEGQSDTNTFEDVFAYQTATADVELISRGAAGGTVPPCILLDISALHSNAQIAPVVAGACGVPLTARAVSAKVTVQQSMASGNLQFYPGNDTSSPAAILRFAAGAVRTESFTLPLATNGAGTLAILPFVAGNGTVHVIVEVNGYSE